MRFDLTKPCKNCPFGVAETRIKFACAERAEEIAESAYRNGFPCHLSADYDEREWVDGFVFGGNTQHCAGTIGMFLNDGNSEWPGIDNDDEIATAASERLWEALDMCFASEEAFIEANRSALDG